MCNDDTHVMVVDYVGVSHEVGAEKTNSGKVSFATNTTNNLQSIMNSH